jgi:Holliday junction DNA helicase RuvA
MFSHIRGFVTSISGNTVVVDANGLGYAISVTPQTLSKLSRTEEVTIPVLLIVREDSMTLFGFSSEDEKTLFSLLQTVSGVGPKLALTILAATNPESLASAIVRGDELALTKIPGVGKKSAARLILELGDKLTAITTTPQVATSWQDDVEAALVSLGWNAKEAALAVSKVNDSDVDPKDPGAALREALATLNRSSRA